MWRLSIALLVSSCAINPVSGRFQIVAMSERGEAELGAKLLHTMQHNPGVIAEGPLADYLHHVGTRVASIAAPRSFTYQFLILDDPTTNAYALPGGHVLVSRGLLAICNQEAEIASVLGHELGHVWARHAAARAAIKLPADLIARVVAKTVAVFNPREAEQIRDTLPRMLVAPYSRGQEREADRVGVVLAASLGYDPAGLGRILRRMREGQTDNSDSLATHPPTPDRIALIDLLAATLERGPADPVANRDELLHLLDGLPLGPGRRIPRVMDDTLVIADEGLTLAYPDDWNHQVAGDEHVAVAPAGEAVLSLRRVPAHEEQVAEGDLDWQEPFITTGGHLVEHAAVVLGGRPAGIARVYWLTHAGTRYQLTGTWLLAADAKWTAKARTLVTSATTATPVLLSTLSVTRLRLVRALQDEDLDAFAVRSASAWDGEEIARANGLDVDRPLTEGQLLKIARREPFVAAETSRR